MSAVGRRESGAFVRRVLPRAAGFLSLRTRYGRARAAALALLVVAVIVAAIVGPGLSPADMEGWASGTGWWFPALFVLVHAVVCVAPVPRTAFTIAAGVLFPPLTGVLLALTGTALSAALTYLAGRALGREAVLRRITHPTVRRVDDRLRRRGWLAVASLRLIPIVPFSVLSYCCSVSGVRMVPFLVATVLGSLPGTVAVVYLGDAATGGFAPASLAVSAGGILAGVTGLVVDVQRNRREERRRRGAEAE